MEGDPAEAAIYSRLYEAKDAVASCVPGVNGKIRVDRRSCGLKYQETKDKTYLIGKLNFGKPIAPTHKRVESPPQAQSMLFDEDGRVYTLTVGYCMDKRIGNTEGLGGVFALLKGIGKPLPFPEAQRLYTPSLRFEAFERIAKVGESLGYGPNAVRPPPKEML